MWAQLLLYEGGHPSPPPPPPHPTGLNFRAGCLFFPTAVLG